MAEAQQFAIDLGTLEAMAKSIAETDAKLSAASGNEAAIKKSVTEAYATEHAGTVDKLVKQVLTALEKMPVEAVIGFTDRLETVVDDAFSEQVDSLLDAKVKEAAASSGEDVSKLKEERKMAVEQFKALKMILETNFHVDTSSVSEPKSRRGAGSGTGSSTKKNARNKEGYRYSIDGKERPASQNSFSAVAYHSSLGCAEKDANGEDQRWGVEQLRDFLTAEGVKWGPPGEGDDTWEVTLPNKKKVSARRLRDDEFVEEAPTTDATTPDETQAETAPEPANA